jgi:hypothetical protein
MLDAVFARAAELAQAHAAGESRGRPGGSA